MTENQEERAGGFGSPQGALFRQKLAKDNIGRFRERYEKTAQDLLYRYERKKREEDFVGARQALCDRAFFLKLQDFTERLLATFSVIEMNEALTLFLLEVADALKTVEEAGVSGTPKQLSDARRKLEDISRTIAEHTGVEYVRLFPKEGWFAKWKRLRSERKKSAEALLAETEAEFGIQT
ncbi:MAG: hypothetical protein IJB97_02640 [Clostridia bacterium]|nr:hypothetical protein [Clostridia bacterium]